jgi:hypothetical protein
LYVVEEIGEYNFESVEMGKGVAGTAFAARRRLQTLKILAANERKLTQIGKTECLDNQRESTQCPIGQPARPEAALRNWISA